MNNYWIESIEDKGVDENDEGDYLAKVILSEMNHSACIEIHAKNLTEAVRRALTIIDALNETASQIYS